MKYLPTNTLAHYNAAPQRRLQNLAGIPVEVFAKSTTEYRKSCGMASPDTLAITFYALNHSAAIVRKLFTPNEPLPEWAEQVMREYTKALSVQSTRMIHYLLSITTREMRHLKSVPSSFWSSVTAECGAPMVEFMKAIKSNPDEEQAVKRYMSNPPMASVGQYLTAMAKGFHLGHGQSWAGSYGGPAWGEIADHAVKMVKGEATMEWLVDTGYNLAHNTAPIFNKGMMYHGPGGDFETVLDVQASGQVPSMILSADSFHPLEGVNSLIPATVRTIIHTVHQHVTEESGVRFPETVDWYAVHNKKNAQRYKPHQKEQDKGKKKIAATPAAPVVPDVPKVKMVGSKKAKVVGTWQVFPGQTVDVVERLAS